MAVGLRHVGLRPQPGLKTGSKAWGLLLKKVTLQETIASGWFGVLGFRIGFRVLGFRV